MKHSEFDVMVHIMMSRVSTIKSFARYTDTDYIAFNKLDVRTILNRLDLITLRSIFYVFQETLVPAPHALKSRISDHYKHYWLVCCVFDTAQVQIGQRIIYTPKAVCANITNFSFHSKFGTIGIDQTMDNITKAKLMEDEITNNPYIIQVTYTHGTPAHIDALLEKRRDDLLTAYKKQDMTLAQVLQLSNYLPSIHPNSSRSVKLSQQDIKDMPNYISTMMKHYANTFQNNAWFRHKAIDAIGNSSYIHYPFELYPKKEDVREISSQCMRHK